FDVGLTRCQDADAWCPRATIARTTAGSATHRAPRSGRSAFSCSADSLPGRRDGAGRRGPCSRPWKPELALTSGRIPRRARPAGRQLRLDSSRTRGAGPQEKGETPFSKGATGQQLARVRGCALFPAALHGPEDDSGAETDDDEVQDDLSRDD